MKFLNRDVGYPHRPFYIAEISCNHRGNLEEAKRLIYLAANSGADAVKIQLFEADEMTINFKHDNFMIKDGPWQGRNLYDLYLQAATPYMWLPDLIEAARNSGVPLFGSVFSKKGVDTLYNAGIYTYKISSFENEWDELINYAAKFGKDLVVSLGGRDPISYGNLITSLKNSNLKNKVLLHCVNEYPTHLNQASLARLNLMMTDYKAFLETDKLVFGLSDHSIGTKIAEYATVIGARVIEKHFVAGINTLDSNFSATPDGFRKLVNNCNSAFETLSTFEIPKKDQFRRSIFVVKEIKKGEVFTREHIAVIRPSNGLNPRFFNQIIGKIARKDIRYGTPLNEEMVQW